MPTDWNNPDEIILAELEPAEELLWAGRPKQGLIFRRAEFVLLFMALIVFGPSLSAFFRAGPANNGQAFPPFLIFGLPHLLFMTTYLFGRPIYDAWSRRRCAYGVTSERVVMVGGLFGRRVRSLELDALVDAKFTPTWRGEGGTIRFGHDAGHAEAANRGRQVFISSAIDCFELDLEPRKFTDSLTTH